MTPIVLMLRSALAWLRIIILVNLSANWEGRERCRHGHHWLCLLVRFFFLALVNGPTYWRTWMIFVWWGTKTWASFSVFYVEIWCCAITKWAWPRLRFGWLPRISQATVCLPIKKGNSISDRIAFFCAALLYNCWSKFQTNMNVLVILFCLCSDV